jgi:hypothetical protein
VTLPILIAGLVLWLAGPWFSGQQTVGIILTIAGGVLLILQLAIFGGIFKAASKDIRTVRGRFR